MNPTANTTSPPKPVAPDSHTLWAARVRVAILEELTSSHNCTVDRLHRAGEPANPKKWGGVFSDPTIAPLIRHTGYNRSLRREAHGRPISQWELRPGWEGEAANRLAAARTALAALEALTGNGDQLPLPGLPLDSTPATQLLPNFN